MDLRVIGCKNRGVTACILLLLVVAVPVLSQHQVLYVTISENTLPRLTEMTSRGMAIELERAGLQVQSDGTYLPADIDQEQILRRAERGEAQYVASLRFDSDGVTADVAMALYETSSGLPLAEEGRQEIPLELEFDSVVVSMARSLVSEAGITFDRVTPTPVAATGEQRDDLGPGTARDPAPDPPRTPGLTPVPTNPPTETRAEQPRGVAYGIGIAPAFVTGENSDFLKLGGMTTATVDLRVHRGLLGLDVGVVGGFLRLVPDDISGIDGVDIVPLGVSARGVIASEQPISSGIRFTAGPAILTIRGSPNGDLSKVLPHIIAGFDASWHLHRSFAVRLDSSYFIFFERPYPVMAFIPSILLVWRS